jgi:ATP-dependent helicase HrpB
VGRRDTAIVATCAMPVPLAWLLAAGVGRDRVAQIVVKRDRLVAQVERVHARKVLETREEIPEGALARDAFARAFLEGRLWPDTLALTRDRLEATALQARLDEGPAPPDLEAWVRQRIEELGVETGEDLALLSPEDLLADDLPAWQREALDRAWPRRLELPDATYAVRYELDKRRVVLDQISGKRPDPPPRSWLPAFKGLRVRILHGRVQHDLR